jgi:hypothetical protein
MPTTVINGPPERSRTRLPVLNAGAAWFCIAVFDGAGSEKAGDKGILSASVTPIVIDACLMEANMLNSILKCAACSSRPGQLAAAAALGVARARARMDETCSGTVKAKVAISYL